MVRDHRSIWYHEIDKCHFYGTKKFTLEQSAAYLHIPLTVLLESFAKEGVCSPGVKIL